MKERKSVVGRDVPDHSWTGYTRPFLARMWLWRCQHVSWPRCTWPFLAEMYPTIPGWDVVVILPTCVLAEMYLAILGRDVPGHSWLGCGCDAANMCLGRDVPGHSWPRCTQSFLSGMWLWCYQHVSWPRCTRPFLADMWLASCPTRLVSPLLWVVMCHFCRIYFIIMGGSSRAMKLPFPFIYIYIYIWGDHLGRWSFLSHWYRYEGII